MSKYIPENISNKIPDRIPNKISNKTSKNILNKIPKNISNKIPKNLPNRMSENMPNYLPKDMPDRMPEDMSVRKYINVMVGIIRNKIIYIYRYFSWIFISFIIFVGGFACCPGIMFVCFLRCNKFDIFPDNYLLFWNYFDMFFGFLVFHNFDIILNNFYLLPSDNFDDFSLILPPIFG